MTKRIVCLLLATLAAVNLHIPALAQEPPAGPGGTCGGVLAANTKEDLPAPTVTLAQTDGGIQVTWNKVSGSPRYMVYYKENGGGWHRIGTTANTSYTRAASKLKTGVTYQFTVRCCANDKKTLLGGYKASAPLQCSLALTAPTVKIATAANGVKVTWNRVSGAARYAVYYREGSGSWHKIGTTAATSYTWKKAVSGRTYQFTVRCTDANKVSISSYKASNSLKFLAAPKVKSVTGAVTGVKVTWGAVKGAGSYRVYYKTGSGGWTKAGTTAETSYTVTGLRSGTKYSFTVRCMDSSGKSFASGYDPEGKSLLYLAAPTVKLVNINNGMKATWKKVSGASGYKVYFRAKGSGGWNLLGETTSASYIWDDAVLGMSYAFTVRAICNGASSAYRSGAYVKYTGRAASPTDT